MWNSDEFRGYDVESELESREDLQVYRAVDQSDGSRVTLLVYRNAESGSPSIAGYERESDIRRRIQRIPGIEPTITEGSTKRGVPFVVLPDRTTGSIEALLDSRTVSVAEAVELTTAIGMTVAAMNATGVVVSTVDPANVSLDARPMLRDLSEARVAGVLHESLPGSDAPEITRGQPPTQLTDVWAMAAFLYWLLEPGTPPNPGGGLASDPRIPGELADTITRALSIEPVDRQANVAAFLAAVSVASGPRDTARPVATTGPPTVEPDDDPTVQADEDLIRQIRVASTATDMEAPAPDDDPTVVADEDLIRQIRVASAVSEPPSEQREDDPTMVVDDDMVRQIRVATSAATTSQPVGEDADQTIEADESLIREVRSLGGSPSPPDSAIDNGTVVAGEDLVRQIRVAGTPAVTAPAAEPPEIIPADHSSRDQVDRADGFSEPAQILETVPESAPPSIDDLRRRFSPQVQQAKSEFVPRWVLIAGVGFVGLLVVMILAVVLVG